jgi:uncharacterized protein YhaN
MRLVTLDLNRYGPFTGQTLTFEPGAKLHVVYGPNEAGKSCSLAAVTDLLFGIERLTRYDFLHSGNDMRVGGTIAARDGRSLSFRRRKGNKNTIVNTADVPLSDEALLPFLGTLSRDVFCHAFGLNTATLRAGAEEMLRNDGDVGASLFAAASGLRGLTELRRDLDAEADSIFTIRASKERRFYQALERYENARREIRERELKAGDWNSLNDAIEIAAQRLNEIKTLRATKTSEVARLSRLKRVAPLVRLIDADIARLDAIGPLPEVSASFIEHLRTWLTDCAAAEEAQKRAFADEGKAVRAHAEIHFDAALIADAADVLRLFTELGAQAIARRDLPRIEAETDDYRDRLAKIATALGLADATVAEEAQPTEAAQALIRSLIAEGRKLTAELERHRSTLASERIALTDVERQRGERGQVSDPAALQEKLKSFSPVLKQLEKRPEIERTIQADARNIKEAAGRLDPPVTNLDAIAQASLPNAETIAHYRKELDSVAQEIGRERDRISAAIAASGPIQTRLTNLAAGRPVPTADAIAAKRLHRDAGWKPLRATLFGTEEAITGAALFETVADFERHNLEADQLADDATRDATRVATHLADTNRLAEERAQEQRANEALTSLEARQLELANEWKMAWVATSIVPQPPAQMISWLSTVNALLDRREKLQILRDELAALEAEARGIEPTLAVIVTEAGLPALEGIGAILTAKRIEDHLRLMKDSWDRARDLETSFRDTQRRIERHTTAEANSVTSHDEWLGRWQLAVPQIGLLSAATMDEAEAALACWKDVPEIIRERDKSARRVAGIQRDIDGFSESAGRVVVKIAPDLAAMSAEAAIKTLSARLTEARTQETRKSGSAARLEEATQARIDAEAATREATDKLATLAAELPQDTNLPALLDRVAERNRFSEGLDARRTQLISQADGHTEEALRSDLAGFDIDQAEAMLKTLAGEEDLLNNESQEVFAEHDRSVRRRGVLEQGVGAEVSLQQRRSAEAELAVEAREWAVLKLGALLIGGVVDRHRTSQQNPLIARAGELFATLTGGAFAGLGHDYDEHDQPRLVGNRNSGGTVAVSGMSDGTRDQLFLALRLAYLEDYAKHAEPVPFICDDLFVTFDDARTSNALNTLAAIGRQVQPILFTHHSHVVDIARKNLGATVNVIELS